MLLEKLNACILFEIPLCAEKIFLHGRKTKHFLLSAKKNNFFMCEKKNIFIHERKTTHFPLWTENKKFPFMGCKQNVSSWAENKTFCFPPINKCFVFSPSKNILFSTHKEKVCFPLIKKRFVFHP